MSKWSLPTERIAWRRQESCRRFISNRFVEIDLFLRPNKKACWNGTSAEFPRKNLPIISVIVGKLWYSTSVSIKSSIKLSMFFFHVSHIIYPKSNCYCSCCYPIIKRNIALAPPARIYPRQASRCLEFPAPQRRGPKPRLFELQSPQCLSIFEARMDP